MTDSTALAERAGGFLAEYGAETTPVSLTLPDDLPFEQYQEVVAKLGMISSAVPWYIGMAMLHGERAYGEAYAQAMNETGLAYQTLANYVSVAKNVPVEVRRADLSHGHHAAVAMLRKGDKPDTKAQTYWLRQAADKQWSRSQLREAIAASGQQGAGTHTENDPGKDSNPDPAPAQDPGAGAGEWQPAPGGPDPALESALRALRDAYDAVVPAEALHTLQGYYAVPQDVVEEIAVALGEEFTPEPYDDGNFRPVVEGEAQQQGVPTPAGEVQQQPELAPASIDADLPMAAPAAPAQPAQTTTGRMVLDPSMVRIAGEDGAQQQQGLQGLPPEHPAAQGPPTAPPPEGGETFEGFGD